MELGWIEDKITKIETASFALLETLNRDDPDRIDKTQYQYPKEEYVSESFHHVQQACRSVVLAVRLLRCHFDRREYELREIDIMAMQREQHMWQRKLSEIFCNLVNLNHLGRESFILQLLHDKTKIRKQLRDELFKIYGSRTKQLDLYCDNDQRAFEDLSQRLPNSSVVKWDNATSIKKAFEHLTDTEKYALGHYFDFRIRSGSIHFATFPKVKSGVDPNTFLHHLTITALLAQFIVIRSARMFPLVLAEVGLLSEPDIEKIFDKSYLDSMDIGVSVGDPVVVRQGNQNYEGRVEEIRSGALGGKSYRVSISGNPGSCSRSDFHAAKFARRKD